MASGGTSFIMPPWIKIPGTGGSRVISVVVPVDKGRF